MVAEATINSIFRFAVCSRIFLLCLSFITNLIVPDHEASDVFIYAYPNEESIEFHFLDHIIYTLFGGLIRWDANYFLHIAHYGYTEERMLAFFPLFPFVTRLVASLLYLFTSSFVTYNALLLLSSVFINFFMFIKCSIVLYELTLKITKDDVTAYYSAIVFCVNPASIFFSAPYSETLYSYLTFLTMLNCIDNNFLVASLISGLSCAARSNGVLNTGFILFAFLVFFVRQFSFSLSYLLTFVFLLAVFLVVSLAPFYLVQLYAYVRFCPYIQTNLAPLTTQASWCNDAIPLAYSYVQSKYWNVGFLKYYEMKQIPNFLLAAPIIYVLLTTCYKKITGDKEFLNKIFSLKIISEIKDRVTETIDKLNYFVFVVHVALLTVFCVFFVHIQVSTRMLCSSSPAFYWFVADCFKSNCDAIKKHKSVHNKLRSDFAKLFNRPVCADYIETRQKGDSVYGVYIRPYWKMFYTKDNNSKQFLLILYCLGYFVIGTVLFSNFYPWT